MDTKELTIAVNGYRSPEILRLCLQSIAKEMSASGIDYEVLVADSATEETTEMLMREEFSDVRFFPFKKNVGFKTLINTSITEARGTYIFLINSDILISPGAVPELLSYLKAHPEIGILGPRQFNFNGTPQQSCYRFYHPLTIIYRRTFLGRLAFARRHLRWFTYTDHDLTQPKSVDWLIGSAMLVSRKDASTVGPMDDRYFMYMEDVDWCRRFWEKGRTVVYYPKAFVYHYHAKGSAKGGFFGSLLFNRLTWYHIESALRYFWKYRGKSLPRITYQDSPMNESEVEAIPSKERGHLLFKRAFFFLFALSLLGGVYYTGYENGRGSETTVDLPRLDPSDAIIINKKSANETIDFSLFWKVWEILKDKYVDKANLDARELFYGAIDGMLSATGDPYTTFFSPQENEEFNKDISGTFEGIGAEMGIKDDIIMIIAPLEGAPAEKAGLLAGDKIVKIDDTVSSNFSLDEAVKRIRGKKGTIVKLTIFREGEEETREIAVTRDFILVKSVRFEMKDGDVAYIRVNRFGEDTDDAFKGAVSEAKKANARAIVLDLRNNPGGFLETAVDMASLMLPPGKVVVMEEDGNGKRIELRSRGGNTIGSLPTIILINQGSASASEILAGALRENRDDVILVGKKSFGKGSVQELVSVSKDSAVKITIARWLTPKGNQIHNVGIVPDVEIGITADDLKEKRDPQLDRALEEAYKMLVR